MQKKEIEILIEQIKSIVYSKPFVLYEQEKDDNFTEAQQILAYLSQCIIELNQFLVEIAAGNLATKPPSRQNFLAGNIKELHSGLRHLTWQANQVALGDYSQNVSFLGEFSDSFNKMIAQLKEREEKLKHQSEALEESNKLLKSIMDGISDSIIVVSQKDYNIVYKNKTADKVICSKELKTLPNDEHSLIKEVILQNPNNNKIHNSEIYYCEVSKRFFQANTFLLHWNGDLAYANHIVDITEEYEEKSLIESIAYKDELTGLYNRRFCLSMLEKLIKEKAVFTFCLLDADKLKFANDNYGHSAGDDYLKAIANEISLVSRSSDFVCRFGGDEFAIIFVECGKEFIVDKLEKINTKLKSMQVSYPMSVSCGAIFISSDNQLSSEAIINEADMMMYEEKRKKNSS